MTRNSCMGLFVAGSLALGLTGMWAAPEARADVHGNYPERPVTVIVPFAPGGSTDPVARLFAGKLAEAWDQQVVVDNRPGAGGSIGGTALVESEADGYTLMVTNQGPAILSVMLSQDPPFMPEDLEPIIYIGHMPQIAIANPDFPADSIAELVEYAEENPGAVLWGSSGLNANPHIAMEILRQQTGIEVTHVPYGGSGPAVTDLLAGNIHVMYSTAVTAAGIIESGDVKVLGVAGHTRQDVLPDVPTLSEQGIEGAESSVWLGMVAPAGTPPEIIEKVNAAMNEAMQHPDVQEQLFTALEPVGGSIEEFRDFFNAEVERVQSLLDAGVLERQ